MPTKTKASGRKRHDPADKNILSDPKYDTILNPDPSKKYWAVTDEDMPLAIGRGYRRIERTPEGPRPSMWWEGQADHGPGYRVNNELTWMECDRDRAEQYQSASEERHNSVMREIQRKVLDPSVDDTRYVSYTTDKGYKNRFEIGHSEEAR